MADEYIPTERAFVTRSEAKSAGLKRYFTGKPCKNGHLTERLASGACVECSRMLTGKWRSNNSEKKRAYAEAWYAANAEKQRLGAKIWAAENQDRCIDNKKRYRAENADKIRATKRAYRIKNAEIIKTYYAENKCRIASKQPEYMANMHAENREKRNEQARIWKAKNIDRIKAYAKKWRSENPEKNREKSGRYRAKKVNSVGKFSAEDVARLFEAQKYSCAHSWCRKPIKSGYHIDHVMPLALGGSNWPSNLQLLCKPCNLKKGAKHPIDFARKNGMLL